MANLLHNMLWTTVLGQMVVQFKDILIFWLKCNANIQGTLKDSERKPILNWKPVQCVLNIPQCHAKKT